MPWAALSATLTCTMSSGHSNVGQWPLQASDPPVHSSGEGSEKAVKPKKKKRRRSGSVRGTASGGASLEPNGTAHPQQHPTTTPASPHITVPDTASAINGRVSSPVPRSRRNSEDVIGSRKASGMGGASLPSDIAGSPDHHHHHHHDNGNGNDNDDDQDEGVVIQRDTLSASGSAHLADKKGKWKKRKDNDGRHRKHPLAISTVGDAADGSATSSLAGDSTEYFSGSNTELARSRRKKKGQETGGSDEPPSGIPYALPTSGRYTAGNQMLSTIIDVCTSVSSLVSSCLPVAVAPFSQQVFPAAACPWRVGCPTAVRGPPGSNYRSTP